MRRGHVVRVLGPIDVSTPDGVVEVGGRHPRVLLGSLALAAGRTVSADHLIEIMWGEGAPPCAPATLQSYVSRLRSLLGSDSIRLVDHGYNLEAGVDELDALRFERLVRAAKDENDPEIVRSLCHEALELWRGTPFGELADEDPFRLEALRLDELRMVAMETQLEAELALDHADLVVGTLEAAVEETPYREHLWLLLIEALARDGRRVEALRTCDELRRLLGEVGLEGSRRLTDLEDRIIAGSDL